MSACRDVATPTVLGGAPRPLAPRGPPGPPRAPCCRGSGRVGHRLRAMRQVPGQRRDRDQRDDGDRAADPAAATHAAGGSPVGGVVRDGGFGWSMRASCWRIFRGEPAARSCGPHPRGGRCSNLFFEWLVPRDQAAARRRRTSSRPARAGPDPDAAAGARIVSRQRLQNGIGPADPHAVPIMQTKGPPGCKQTLQPAPAGQAPRAGRSPPRCARPSSTPAMASTRAVSEDERGALAKFTDAPCSTG
jgi:hypothetical protein